jgi:hypothetical protein
LSVKGGGELKSNKWRFRRTKGGTSNGRVAKVQATWQTDVLGLLGGSSGANNWRGMTSREIVCKSLKDNGCVTLGHLGIAALSHVGSRRVTSGRLGSLNYEIFL